MLRLIVDLVEASIYADNPEWRLRLLMTREMLTFLESNCFSLFLWQVHMTFLCYFPLSIDEQVTKDIQLIDAIAERQAQIFSEECKLFPADVQIQSIYPL